MSESPANQVEVPEWVARIEGLLALVPEMFFGTDKEGRTARLNIPFNPPLWGMSAEQVGAIQTLLEGSLGDLYALCKEVRELLAIVSDLREERGSIIFMVLHYPQMYPVSFFHDRASAERMAERLSAKRKHRSLVARWVSGEHAYDEVSFWCDTGRRCLKCRGGGWLFGIYPNKACEECAGTGRYYEDEAGGAG